MSQILDKHKKEVSLLISVMRAAAFITEGALLPVIDRAATGKKNFQKSYPEHLKEALPRLQKLILQDCQMIADNQYPVTVLLSESPLKHLIRLPELLKDAFQTSKRRLNKNAHQFEPEAGAFAVESPAYYQRNFHFQNNGYLSDESAELYDHQVELLFAGAAGAMRRLMIPDIKDSLKSSDGEGLKFLELGCGTGSLTRSMALAFPKAQITCLDPSPFYLKKAQQILKDYNRLDFVRGFAEDLPFKNETYDVVYSCYLFHEIPLEVRKKVLAESVRVLKPQGVIGFVDSIQLGDDPSMDWALKRFPVDFHEPFYKNYAETPMEDLFKQAIPHENYESQIIKQIGFLSKSLVFALKKTTQ